EIQIYHRPSGGRPIGRQARTNGVPEGDYVAFGFDGKYKLTELRVVALSELETNISAHSFWHLVSDSNSVPVSGFIYGERIRGMRPSVKKARAEPLQPNVSYRLLIQSGHQKGHCDFKIKEKNVRGE